MSRDLLCISFSFFPTFIGNKLSDWIFFHYNIVNWSCMSPQSTSIIERLVANLAFKGFSGMNQKVSTEARWMTEWLKFIQKFLSLNAKIIIFLYIQIYFWTERTFVQLDNRILCVISVDVLFQRFFQNKWFRTVVAFEWAFSAMNHSMSFENFFLDEGSATNVTFERLFASMNTNMPGQCTITWERFSTIIAF